VYSTCGWLDHDCLFIRESMDGEDLLRMTR
jgi:hypothetical protein